MHWARASSIARAVACPASLVLPADDTADDRDPEHAARRDEAAAWGLTAHNWKATLSIVAGDGRWPQHAKLFARKLSYMKPSDPVAFRDKWWPAGGQHELSYAIDTRRFGRVATFKGTKEQVAAWAASLGDEWVKGEADYVGNVLGDPWVDDLKTSPPRRVQDPETGAWVQDPDNPWWHHPRDEQHRTYALGAWLAARCEPHRVVTSTTNWPRYPVVGGPERVWAEFHNEELRAWWDVLHDTEIERRRLVTLPPLSLMAAARPSDRCRFCPSLGHCPKGQDFLAPAQGEQE